MLSLHETQNLFVQDLLGRTNPTVVDWLGGSRLMAIYRNNFRIGLRSALATTFPVVTRLVGDGFFAGMANGFVVSQPPSRPCLAEYGEGFPGYIAEYEPAASLPYLADVAQFEWLMNAAANAKDFAGQAFYSPWPIGRIWETNQDGYEGYQTVDLGDGGGWFVVEKANDLIQWRWLDLPANPFSMSAEE